MNDMKDLKNELCAGVSELFRRGIINGDTGALSLRNGRHMFITSGGIFPDGCSAGGISMVDMDNMAVSGNSYPDTYYRMHAALYAGREGVNSIIHCTSPAVMTSSMAGLKVYPMLDDVAMIVGASVRIISCGEGVTRKDERKLLRAMNKRSAVLVYGKGALCAGSDIDDAVAVSLVLEKGCKCFIETSFIGGGVRLNPLEASRMRRFYMSGYSRAASTNR